MATRNGVVPAANGDPGMAASVAVEGSTLKAETLLDP